jgi:hypothetical protein
MKTIPTIEDELRHRIELLETREKHAAEVEAALKRQEQMLNDWERMLVAKSVQLIAQYRQLYGDTAADAVEVELRRRQLY